MFQIESCMTAVIEYEISLLGFFKANRFCSDTKM